MLHIQLIKATGGSFDIRDEGLLESAINIPFQSFSNVDLFPINIFMIPTSLSF